MMDSSQSAEPHNSRIDTLSTGSAGLRRMVDGDKRAVPSEELNPVFNTQPAAHQLSPKSAVFVLRHSEGW